MHHLPESLSIGWLDLARSGKALDYTINEH
jgi:hypothetical protein